MDEVSPQYCNGCRIEHLPGAHLKLDEVDKNHILAVFEAMGRNKTQTAAVLGIDRNTLKARLARYC